MSEIVAEKQDPFAQFRDEIDLLLGQNNKTHVRDTRQSSDFSRITIARDTGGTYGVEYVEPTDDDGQHEVYAYVFMSDGSGVLVKGQRHCTDNGGSLRIESQEPINPDSLQPIYEVLEKYIQAPPGS